MIQIITDKYEDTVAIKMSGKLTQEDYQVVVPLLENKIDQYGKINIYCEVIEVSTMKPGAIWEDLKFDAKHFKNFNRVAIVGERGWLNWFSTFAKPFTTAEIKYYDNYEKAQAMDWVVRGKEEYETQH
ncbi:SpoIIAA family protein [Fulvivirga sediminis]|uniref:STAS/SEC14 domain-containing protein n=1 Tax=Fulvivirga sediminis TaxID=2803949 RepID=A0A937JX82_9BACT|nr:STAS/SEC14 domain-containing protein [Fulvivirga sediminis]MBL3655238.1 STAS/SEC14 domain-containing protein [Fulvivirga sediminis]